MFIVPSSIEPLKNKTDVQKGGNLTLYCDVSGKPTPHVSWTHVKTGRKWFSKTVVILDVKVDDLGEYKCEASNPYGNDTKTTFVFCPGNCLCSFGRSLMLKDYTLQLNCKVRPWRYFYCACTLL